MAPGLPYIVPVGFCSPVHSPIPSNARPSRLPIKPSSGPSEGAPFRYFLQSSSSQAIPLKSQYTLSLNSRCLCVRACARTTPRRERNPTHHTHNVHLRRPPSHPSPRVRLSSPYQEHPRQHEHRPRSCRIRRPPATFRAQAHLGHHWPCRLRQDLRRRAPAPDLRDALSRGRYCEFCLVFFPKMRSLGQNSTASIQSTLRRATKSTSE